MLRLQLVFLLITARPRAQLFIEHSRFGGAKTGSRERTDVSCTVIANNNK